MAIFLLILLVSILILMVVRVLYYWCILPNLAYFKLMRNGFEGPVPSFPFGNLGEMKKLLGIYNCPQFSSPKVTNDIHSIVFPYFAKWQKSYGKVFTYWLGTEPFVYIANPQFLKEMSAGVMGKSWGKPNVFKNDRNPMFGEGLVMVEGEDWVRHRQAITPAFSPSNLKAMTRLMTESTTRMLDRWTTLINSGHSTLDIEREIINLAGEIIAKTSFGIDHGNGTKVLSKLRALQMVLFKTPRNVGVPFSKIFQPKSTLEANKLGKEIDKLLLKIINERKRSGVTGAQTDLLGILLADSSMDGRMTTRDLVDECKTFFFGGHETTALLVSWSMLLLALHPEWQEELREEIREVVRDKEVDATMLVGLKKMGWVMNEVLRLYSPAPNVQRQARRDIKVGNKTIPNGTNIWIDVVSMHHDREYWGDDVYEFKPERFRDDNMYGGCKNNMGFLPFGFGGRMCVGRKLTMMEYKVVLSSILGRFSFSLSKDYCHSPSIMLSLRPAKGLPLVLHPFDE